MGEHVAVRPGDSDVFDLAVAEARDPDQVLRTRLGQPAFPPAVFGATDAQLASRVGLREVAPQTRM